ncbi:MAG: HlyD family efflux transporter periplasmic adaptor subunit [Acetobacteraceae bacterium]
MSQDLTDAQRKLDDMSGSLRKADLRNKLVDLRADMDATVLTRAAVSVGSVLQSGDQFFTLIPLDSPMEVQVNIVGSDAGSCMWGDTVNVKFDTFPFIRYGGATGKVRSISPDSFVSDQPPNQGGRPNPSAQPSSGGSSFFRAWVTLDHVDLHDTPPGFHLTPGMPTTADVMVGKRSVLTYILGRVLPVAMDGMREP